MVTELADAGAVVGFADGKAVGAVVGGGIGGAAVSIVGGRAVGTVVGAADGGLHPSSRVDPASPIADTVRFRKKSRRLMRRLLRLSAERLRVRVDLDNSYLHSIL